MIFTSPFPDVDIPGTPLTPFVLRHADRLAAKPAVVDAASGRSYTYGQLARDVRRLAAGLRARGFRRGDVLAIMAPNLPEYPAAFHGTALAGGVVTTVNPMYTAAEIAVQLRDSKARLLVTVPALLEKAANAASGSPVEEIVVFGEAEGATSFASLLADADAGQAGIDPATDPVALPYSSGTTGFAKGVILTHRNLVANLAQSSAAFGIAENDKACAFLPFFHSYGMQVIMNSCLCQGATLVTMQGFELEPFLQAVQDHRLTRLYLVPPVVLLLAKSPVVGNYDLSTVKIMTCGAAPLDAQIARACEQRTGGRLRQGYGMTETSPVTHCTPADAPNVNLASVGPLVPNTECKIIDVSTGQELGPGQDGEICVRGPQVMKGYLNNDQATWATIDGDGFLHTGDIGHVDHRGDFFIVDRVKDLIKYKGYQVPPAELEAHLLAHPQVADAAVIGVRDDDGEEIPKAFVVPRGLATPEELMDFVAARVAPHKKIRRLEIIADIPKSPTGKILRRVLQDRERTAPAAQTRTLTGRATPSTPTRPGADDDR
jgi:acyl-CoA synthetase (AMP-forming)/AMP-acid ligase II